MRYFNKFGECAESIAEVKTNVNFVNKINVKFGVLISLLHATRANKGIVPVTELFPPNIHAHARTEARKHPPHRHTHTITLTHTNTHTHT